MKIPCVVVLYNPNIGEVVSNIKTYIGSLEILYIFDNSDSGIIYQETLENISPKIKYYSCNGNKGISFALNYISQIAYKSNFEWILTMDQDSSFSLPNGFDLYIDLIRKELDSKVGLFCPSFPKENAKTPQFYTSGSLININAWLNIGKFDENLFIDEVDGDFTYRLSEANYKLIKIHDIKLNHKLGDQLHKSFFGKTLSCDNHSAIRKYYIARNRIYLMKKRPNMRMLYFTDSLTKFILFILIEPDKKRKMTMLIRGVCDGLRNKMGKYMGK